MREFLISVDMAELTLRLFEATMQVKRPQDGNTTVELLKTLPPDMEEGFHRAARAAADYFGEVLTEAMTKSGNGVTVVDLPDGAGHA